MNIILASLGGLGGIVAFITGCYFVIRAVSKLINATQANTIALLSMSATVSQNTIDIAVLKDRYFRSTGGHNAV
jgi:hypothetical protein